MRWGFTVWARKIGFIVFRAQCKISMWGSKVIKNFKTKMGEQETKHRGF